MDLIPETIAVAVIITIGRIIAPIVQDWIKNRQKKVNGRTTTGYPEIPIRIGKIFTFKYIKFTIIIFLILLMIILILKLGVLPYSSESGSLITATPPPTTTPLSTPTATATSSPTVTPPSIIWQESDMGFTIEEQNHLAIGAGRGDDVMRVYASVGREIYEYTFDSGGWDIDSFGYHSARVNGLIIGMVRNDGISRVYTLDGFGKVHEYYYSSNLWLGGETGTPVTFADELVLGSAHNDGYVRMYMSGGHGHEISEISYNYGDWDVTEIGTGGQIVVTDCRNDGVLRVYAAYDEHVYEFSWLGTEWQVEDCGIIDIKYYGFADICAGDGRNDGLNRIYIAGNHDKGIYELSYDGQSWQYTKVSESASADCIVLSNGRNDGINRLYTGSSKGVGEYTYNGSWAKTSLVETSYEVNDLAVGNGRNDGINHVYVTGDDNHIYEYSIG
jgi:hypothetical protein